ncbi:class IV adenylate cyclase [Laspinema olomoucense]|uniref:class IV adenylate cyclase n=1 Tax=Laspinema olomoucense TaxID=3231600 RepID=UPI0021BB0838|nr:class IV adenylate cyclase [Laspinema sp. D3c]MCT7992571.1 class IV adenylate cyclase [Laspinema sp. D3c]
MTEQKEIEVKLYLGSDNSDLLKKLTKLGSVKIAEETQEDIYYTSAHKDFIETKECLRIRSTPDFAELTWKPPSSEQMEEKRQFWKQELNIEITDKFDSLRLLLKNLDFIEYVVVKKYRQVFSVDNETTIALDFIDSLGWFLEIETFSSVPEEGVNKNNKIIACLELEALLPINTPYRDLVKAGKV